MDQSFLSYNEILTISNNLSSYSNEMQNKLDEIKSYFDRIGSDGIWSGTAAAEAKTSFDRLSAKFPEFVKSVKDCSDYLARVVENYQNVDNQINNVN